MGKKVKHLQPVADNDKPNAPLQFKVAKDLDKAKKVRPNEVFEKVKLKTNPGKTKKN